MHLLLGLALAVQTPAVPTERLTDAVVAGQPAVVQRLITAGANVNDPDETGMTPLMIAAAEGHTVIVRSLVAAGADVNAKDRDGITALMRAAAANRVASVTVLLGSGADPHARTRDGATALTAAAFGGYVDVVRPLLDRRADPGASDQQGRTPLMAASMNGHPAVVQALLEKGAKVEAADAVGATALRYAAAKGQADVVDILSRAGGKWSDADLMLAADGCHGAVIQVFLEQGGNANAARDGRSALLAAAAGGCVDAVRALVAAGAQIDAKDPNGRTPLMAAAAAGSIELVRVLLDKGANRDAMDNLERTAVMFAELSRQSEVIELLRAQAPATAITVASPVLAANQPIPRDYTADGRNISPPLTWSNLPPGTKEVAVVCEDPDAGNPPPFVHWVIYKIPGTAGGLPENIPFEPDAAMPSSIAGAIQGVSGFRRAIYRGPAPPPGKPHQYHFIVYAIDAALDLKPGLTRADLLAAVQGHVIGQGELVATYQR